MAAVQKQVMCVKHVFKQYNMPCDTYALCLCEISAINSAKRRRKSPGLEMLRNVTVSDAVMETTGS